MRPVKNIIVLFTLVFIVLCPLSAYAGEKWLGTDDLVDQKLGEANGPEAREPLIDISEGNLGLFLFAAGGFGAGAIIGYQWRKIFGEKAGVRDD